MHYILSSIELHILICYHLTDTVSLFKNVVLVCALGSYELHSPDYIVSSGLHSSWDIVELGA